MLIYLVGSPFAITYGNTARIAGPTLLIGP